MKKNTFRGDLTDIYALHKALIRMRKLLYSLTLKT